MRIIYMGSPQFACPTLQSLIDSKDHEVVAVYSQPPRPMGRGYKMIETPIHDLAESYNIPVFTPTSLKSEEEHEHIQSLNADIGVVAAYGLILPESILNLLPRGFLNVHASLLPRWRGAAPIHRALLAGDEKTGICIMQMEKGLDTGPVWKEGDFSLNNTLNVQEVEDNLATMGADLMIKTLSELERGTISSTPQPEEGVTYAHKIKKEEAFLDIDEDGPLLQAKVRAFAPKPGAWFIQNGKRIKILSSSFKSLDHDLELGTLTVLNSDLIYPVKGGVLVIKILQKEGGKPMNAQAYKVGMR